MRLIYSWPFSSQRRWSISRAGRRNNDPGLFIVVFNYQHLLPNPKASERYNSHLRFLSAHGLICFRRQDFQEMKSCKGWCSNFDLMKLKFLIFICVWVFFGAFLKFVKIIQELIKNVYLDVWFAKIIKFVHFFSVKF